ncbi:MAG: flagellar protein FlaG [Spirochaetales bacterium]|nr:MAG: flagellar protein FlaG [Spirochaetales bacterium]
MELEIQGVVNIRSHDIFAKDKAPNPQGRVEKKQEAQDQLKRDNISKQYLEKYLQKYFRNQAAYNRRLKFYVNEELDQVVVKVIDSATDKVIREIPPEELQRLQVKIREAVGLLFDQMI